MTSVPFPAVTTSDDASSGHSPQRPGRPAYLPFRRMSLTSIRYSIPSSSTPGDQASPTTYSPPVSPRKPRRSSRTSSLARPYSQELNASIEFPNIIDTPELRDKRSKVLNEFHDTERSYLQGLDLIYFHFLQPLIVSLESSKPILSRVELNSVFSNFIDIWNLHRSLFASLTPCFSDNDDSPDPPDITSVLQAHFPYLSLYNPFVTAFPTALSALAGLRSRNPQFQNFMVERESTATCKGLALQAWLLTIVQRCPRYLLLIKDLLKLVPSNTTEHEKLLSVYELVSKITTAFNTSLRTQSQTFELLNLQKATSNLPIQLVSAGRVLLKRDSLFTSGRRNGPRELLLFSDCFLWLAPLQSSRPNLISLTSDTTAPGLSRLRRNSEVTTKGNPIVTTDAGQVGQANGASERRWVYQGRAELVDLDVVARREDNETFDILSPEDSFTVHTAGSEIRDAWIQAIREAKAALLVNLNTMLSNTTLTSSSSNAHVRAMLQALPYTGEEPESGKRLKVDHFTPPVWVPDRKAPACMRCHRKFTWLVRRHHCRLCGRCVCAPCSSRTFFLGDARSKKAANTAARACSACYEAVFPVIENSPPSQPAPTGVSTGTLSGLPNWKTTKQSSFDSSVLRLLGEMRDEGDEPDDLKEYPDEPSNSSQKRDQRRLSSPVIALQKPIVIAQSQNNVIHSSRHVIPSNGLSQPTTDDNRSLGAENAISELQKVLKKT